MADEVEYKKLQTPTGATLAARYLQLLELASKACDHDLPGRVSQGSYHAGTDQSGGTHDQGGAVDLSIRDLDDRERKKIVRVLREHGAVAWLRNPDQGDWPFHIHALDLGANDLSSAAASQLNLWRDGKNGLKSGAADDGPKIDVKPYVFQEDDMPTTEELVAALLPALKAELAPIVADAVVNAPLEATGFAKQVLGEHWGPRDLGDVLVNTTARLVRLEATVVAQGEALAELDPEAIQKIARRVAKLVEAQPGHN